VLCTVSEPYTDALLLTICARVVILLQLKQAQDATVPYVPIQELVQALPRHMKVLSCVREYYAAAHSQQQVLQHAVKTESSAEHSHTRGVSDATTAAGSVYGDSRKGSSASTTDGTATDTTLTDATATDCTVAATVGRAVGIRVHTVRHWNDNCSNDSTQQQQHTQQQQQQQQQQCGASPVSAAAQVQAVAATLPAVVQAKDGRYRGYKVNRFS
jgi:hypothetical protein